MLHALNDMAMIKVNNNKNKLIKTTSDTAESGILVELPEVFTHYGFYSFAFENSLGNEKVLQDLHDYWSKFIGKKVFWLSLSEKGAMLKQEEDTFAFIKLTSLIAVDDANSAVRNIHSNGQGGFSA